MTRQVKKYFSALDEGIQVANKRPIGAMPAQQFEYVHNLNTGQFEQIRNVHTVLGVRCEEFCLEKNYEIIHPADREKVFYATTYGFDFLKKASVPCEWGLQIIYRMFDGHGRIRHILRNTTVFEQLGASITKTYSTCQDVTPLNIYAQTTGVMCNLMKGDTRKIEFRGRKKGCYTKRELEIIRLMSTGLITKEIASALNLSELTVYSHRKNIIKKSGCKSFSEIIIKCYKEGVL